MQNRSDGWIGRMPASINDFNPIPRPGALNITGLVKDSGKVTGYQLSNGEYVTKALAIDMAKAGGINHVGIASRSGSEYLRSLPDSGQENNLGNLPAVTSDSIR